MGNKTISILFLFVFLLESCATNKRGVTEEYAKEFVEKFKSNIDTINVGRKLLSKRKSFNLAKKKGF